MVSERQFKDFPWLYHRNGGGVHIRRWVNHGPLRTLVSMVLPENEIVSQTTTAEQPPYVRAYSLDRVARAFGVPAALLSTEAR